MRAGHAPVHGRRSLPPLETDRLWFSRKHLLRGRAKLRSSGSMSIPHMLRHATGYALANEGTDTRLIQDFLGHASIANTVRYTKLAPGRLAAVRVR